MAVLRCTTAVLLLNSLISPIWAAQCGTSNTSAFLYITSPNDLKNQTQNCDLDTTGLYIAPEFVGAFNLNGISNVSSVELDRYAHQAFDYDFQVTSLDLNETTYMKTLRVTRARGLKSVSAPKLEYVDDLELGGNTTELLDFPSLRNVSSMYLYSNFSSVNFPLLRNVSWLLSYGPLDLDISTGQMPPFQAEFPSLETAAVVSMYGNIASWKTPKLQSIKPSNPNNYVNNEAKLSIQHNGEPLALDFPLLTEVVKIDLSGNISSVSFPALQNVTNLRIAPNGYTNSKTRSTPMKVNLSALRAVQDLSISGNVTSLSLDSLTNFTNLYITSVAPLNCTPIIELYERIRSTTYDPDKFVTGFHCVDSKEQARLDTKYAPKKKRLAKGTVAGIVVAVLAFVFFIGAMWYVNYRSKKKNATVGRRTSGIAEDHELRQRSSMSIKDPAPPYHEAVRT